MNYHVQVITAGIVFIGCCVIGCSGRGSGSTAGIRAFLKYTRKMLRWASGSILKLARRRVKFRDEVRASS